MSTSTTNPELSRGTIVRDVGSTLVFQPLNTNYQHHLVSSSGFSGTDGKSARGVIRVTARKVYSVPSGGCWVAPILGVPKIIQGRVVGLSDKTISIKAGAVFVVELPEGKDSIDLASGAIEVGSLVNVVAMPGARIEIA